MTVSELLEPRIIVENLYPNCPFQALEIICNPSAQQTEWANTYPYIFRWLHWYEERKESELPEYVKWKHLNQVFRIEELKTTNQRHLLSTVLPATKEEFLNQ